MNRKLELQRKKFSISFKFFRSKLQFFPVGSEERNFSLKINYEEDNHAYQSIQQ